MEKVVVQDKIFKDVSEASTFLENLRVVDDCAPDVDLDVNVTYIGGLCEENLFKVTPLHDTGGDIISGIDRIFSVSIDMHPPILSCSLGTQGELSCCYLFSWCQLLT